MSKQSLAAREQIVKERAAVRAYYNAVAEHEHARGDVGRPAPSARGLHSRERIKLFAVACVFGLSMDMAADVINRAEIPGWRTILGRMYRTDLRGTAATHKALAALRYTRTPDASNALQHVRRDQRAAVRGGHL